MGIPTDGVTHWLSGGAEGDVVRIIKGYPRHRCPDHDEGPDVCVCGDYQDESGWVDEQLPSPVVDYACACGEATVPRCISPEDEGKLWEFVRD